MTQQAKLDYIPEYISADARQQILALTAESDPLPAPIKCDESLIRHWCETVEDGNPLYLDEEYARSVGFRDIIAQPGMIICTLTLPYRWPWPPKGWTQERNIHETLKNLFDLPVGILADYDTRFYTPVQIGDSLNTTNRLVAITPWKRTRLGEGHFWTQEMTYRNQKEELVARSRITLFAYGRPTSSRYARAEE